MPWFKTQTLDIPGSGSVVSRLLSGSASEILVHIYDKSGNIFVAFNGSIDSTNVSVNVDPGDVLSFVNTEGFGRLDAWPYIRFANGFPGTCKADIHEWLEDENE